MFEKNFSRRFEAIVVIIDLEKFTPFCSQPDYQSGLPKLLNFLFQLADQSLSSAGLESPKHFKFLGDGALYIWELDDDRREWLGKQIVLAFHNTFRLFPEELKDAEDALYLRAPPARLRAGIASGELAELRPIRNGDSEYVGFAINLAARLQRFCPEIGFLVSATVPLPDNFIDEYSLVRARTRMIRGMRGVQEDIRYIKQDAANLSKRDRGKWFLYGGDLNNASTGDQEI